MREFLGLCVYCGEPVVLIEGNVSEIPPNRATVDHFNPCSQEPDKSKWILALACWRCNNLKDDKPALVFMAQMRAMQEKDGKAAI